MPKKLTLQERFALYLTPIPRHYAVLRADLSVPVQAIQALHAACLAGAQYGVPDYAHIVLLQVKNLAALNALHAQILQTGLPCVLFTDPDIGPGPTALFTGDLLPDLWPVFKKLKLWSANRA